jgi:hypothetical protein
MSVGTSRRHHCNLDLVDSCANFTSSTFPVVAAADKREHAPRRDPVAVVSVPLAARRPSSSDTHHPRPIVFTSCAGQSGSIIASAVVKCSDVQPARLEVATGCNTRQSMPAADFRGSVGNLRYVDGSRWSSESSPEQPSPRRPSRSPCAFRRRSQIHGRTSFAWHQNGCVSDRAFQDR